MQCAGPMLRMCKLIILSAKPTSLQHSPTQPMFIISADFKNIWTNVRNIWLISLTKYCKCKSL